jgi:hypothetical protein
MFRRRIGPDPHANGKSTPSLSGCPDVLELESGDFAVIGVDITAETLPRLAFGASCGADERVVRVPRAIFLAAANAAVK